MASNRFGPLADLEPSLWALSHAVATIVEQIQRPYHQSYKQALLYPVKPEDPVKSFWRKSDSHGEQQCRLHRTETVRLKIEELRHLSSPSHPLCFRCGDCGHRASACRNAVLCFACNRLGHRSSQCRAVLERPPQIPPNLDLTVQPPPTDDLTTKPQLLIPPDVGSGSGQKLIPAYYEILVMDSIKKLGTELAEIKQELALMKKRSYCKIENNRLQQQNGRISATRVGSDSLDDILCEIEDNRLQQQNGRNSATTITTIVTSSREPVGTKSARIQESFVPVTPVDQGSWISQTTRTKFKKAKSESTELNKVALSREKRSVQFKRTTNKDTETEEMRG